MSQNKDTADVKYTTDVTTYDVDDTTDDDDCNIFKSYKPDKFQNIFPPNYASSVIDEFKKECPMLPQLQNIALDALGLLNKPDYIYAVSCGDSGVCNLKIVFKIINFMFVQYYPLIGGRMRRDISINCKVLNATMQSSDSMSPDSKYRQTASILQPVVDEGQIYSFNLSQPQDGSTYLRTGMHNLNVLSILCPFTGTALELYHPYAKV